MIGRSAVEKRFLFCFFKKAVLVFLFAALSSCSSCAEKLVLLHTMSPTMIGVYVAENRGFFQAHGLEVAPLLVTNPAVMPAALMGGSAQIAGALVSSVLLANDGGLDLVVVAGTELFPMASHNGFLARPGLGIHTPEDLVGHRLGIPGIGASGDLLNREYFGREGVDYARVTVVEVPQQKMFDALRSGLVDAVQVQDPIYNHIVDAGVGVDAGSPVGIIPEGTAVSAFASTRAWADAHHDVLAAFRAALAEANAFIAVPGHDDDVRASLARGLKLPRSVTNTIKLPRNQAVRLMPKAVAFWIEMAEHQQMIQGKPDANALVYP